MAEVKLAPWQTRLFALDFTAQEKGLANAIIFSKPPDEREQQVPPSKDIAEASIQALLQMQGPDTVSMAKRVLDLEGKMESLQRMGTWTSRTVQAVGKRVIEGSKVDNELRSFLSELPFNDLPSELADIMNRSFSNLASAITEDQVQERCMLLFTELKQGVEDLRAKQRVGAPGLPCFFVNDTSKKGYPKSPVAEMDFSFTASPGEVVWSNLMWLAEAKPTLNNKDKYEEALGQVSDRARMLFVQQPDRAYVIAAVLGNTSLQILCIPRQPGQGRQMRYTSVLPLSQSSTQSISPAARMLLRLFYTDVDGFDYRYPALPAPFITTCDDGRTFLLSNFHCLRAPWQGASGAYKVELPDGQEVVVKFGGQTAISHEAEVLNLLAAADVPHTPRLLSTGMEPSLGNYLVISPLGRHVGVEDPPELIAQVALDVASTIVQLGAAPVPVLQCDVSANNLLATSDGRGLLTDFGSALSGAGSCGKVCVTGTVLFSAFSVLWGECNNVSSDLESLFYSLVYIALDGEMPGSRELSSRRITAYKLSAMLHPNEFEMRVLQRCPQPLQSLLQKLRNLFFSASPTDHCYIKSINPGDFVQVCKDELALLQSTGAGSPRGRGGSPARGTAALPVQDHSHRTASGMQGPRFLAPAKPACKLRLPAAHRLLQRPLQLPRTSGSSCMCRGKLLI